MAAACALAIFSGIVILISRLSHSAECSKRYFHRRDCKVKEQSKSQNAVDRYDPADEKRIQKSPQTFLNPE